MIKAILFDFNGVIIDDETIQMKAYQEVLRRLDVLESERLPKLIDDVRAQIK